MKQNFNVETKNILSKIVYLIGTSNTIINMLNLPSKVAFDKEVINFLSSLSRELMKDKETKKYPDIVTLGFWIRFASLKQMESRFGFKDNNIHLGCGIAFHVAPSNIPVNFAYSLVVGLLMGNANIVRISSKEFPQVRIIIQAIENTLSFHESVRPYITLIRYDKEREVNDILSSIADVRIIWGGDATIKDIRKSQLLPRSTEITFSDRFSIAIIDTDVYMESNNKKRIAIDFYNDTYLSDQNACSSPKLVIWIGRKKEKAKEIFWKELHNLVKQKYNFQPIMAVNKLTSAYLTAVHEENVKIESTEDNLLVRIHTPKLTKTIIEFRNNSGYFFEYDCDDLMNLKELCNDKRLQTIGLIGNSEMLKPLILYGIKGIDRIVPIGKTMDFDFLWDGYNLAERLTRTIVL